MNHKNKLKLARRLLSKEEHKKHTPPFQSKVWEKRRERITQRIHNRLVREAYAKKARLELLKKHDKPAA